MSELQSLGLQSTESVMRAMDHNQAVLERDLKNERAKEDQYATAAAEIKQMYDLADDWTLRSGHAVTGGDEGVSAVISRTKEKDETSPAEFEVRVVQRTPGEETPEILVNTILIQGPDRFSLVDKYGKTSTYVHSKLNFESARDTSVFKETLPVVLSALGANLQ